MSKLPDSTQKEIDVVTENLRKRLNAQRGLASHTVLHYRGGGADAGMAISFDLTLAISAMDDATLYKIVDEITGVLRRRSGRSS